MRRMPMWILVALLTFTLGVVATTFWFVSRRPVVQRLEPPPCFRPPFYETTSQLCSGADFSALSNIPSLEFCDLVASPDRFEGQIVRVHAPYYRGRHGSLFQDVECAGIDKDTGVLFHPTLSEEIERSLNEASGSDSWFRALDIVAVGRFGRVKPTENKYGIVPRVAYTFEIMRVERASRVR